MHIKKESEASAIKRKLTTIFLLLLVNSTVLLAQKKYIIKDSIPSGHKITQFTLSTKELYGIDKNIELFNILSLDHPLPRGSSHQDNLIADKNLMLFSALPSIEGGDDWLEISLDSLQDQIIAYAELRKLFRKITQTDYDAPYHRKTKFLNEYQIVVKKGNKYYTPANCLLQFYAIRNRDEIFSTIFGTINTQQTARSVADVRKVFKSRFPTTEFPLYMLRNVGLDVSTYTELRDRKEFLAEKVNVANGTSLYKFWTFTGWDQPSFQFDVERGIDRFVYLPGQGIVGGSFDFYFFHYKDVLGLTVKDFIANMNMEKVAIDQQVLKTYNLVDM